MTAVPILRCTSLRLPFLRQFSYIRSLPCAVSTFDQNYLYSKFRHPRITTDYLKYASVNYMSTDSNKDCEREPKLGLVKRFKQMYRDYWYVLVPVHLVTSAGWFCGFYYLAKSGVDIVAILESMGISERFTCPLRDSSMGYLAISYALYKIATPIRYTVTLGGTTISINYLKGLGYIKPVPSKEKLKEMYKERRDNIRETIQETKEELRQRKDQLRERKDNIIGDYTNFKKELKDIKTK